MPFLMTEKNTRLLKCQNSKYICNDLLAGYRGNSDTQRIYTRYRTAKQEMEKRLEDGLESFTLGFDASVGHSNLSRVSTMATEH